jgi:hypothetical protein
VGGGGVYKFAWVACLRVLPLMFCLPLHTCCRTMKPQDAIRSLIRDIGYKVGFVRWQRSLWEVMFYSSQVVFGNHRYISLHYYYSLLLHTLDLWHDALLEIEHNRHNLRWRFNRERWLPDSIWAANIAQFTSEDVPQDVGNPSLPDSFHTRNSMEPFAVTVWLVGVIYFS